MYHDMIYSMTYSNNKITFGGNGNTKVEALCARCVAPQCTEEGNTVLYTYMNEQSNQ